MSSELIVLALLAAFFLIGARYNLLEAMAFWLVVAFLVWSCFLPPGGTMPDDPIGGGPRWMEDQ